MPKHASLRLCGCLLAYLRAAGGSYQAYGYPPGSDGTTTVGIIFNNALRCNTTKFGKHIIMQYTKQVLVPPSQPVSSPPPNAPPPAPLNATGVRYDGRCRREPYNGLCWSRTCMDPGVCHSTGMLQLRGWGSTQSPRHVMGRGAEL